MRRNLGPDGLLMFDVNAIEAYRTFFAEEVEIEREDRRLVWKGRSTPRRPSRAASTEASFEVLPARRARTGRGSRRRCTASATSRKPRSSLPWRRPASSASRSSATAKTPSFKQPFVDEVHHKAVYFARARPVSRESRQAGGAEPGAERLDALALGLAAAKAAERATAVHHRQLQLLALGGAQLQGDGDLVKDRGADFQPTAAGPVDRGGGDPLRRQRERRTIGLDGWRPGRSACDR